jgi:hypothetical protein
LSKYGCSVWSNPLAYTGAFDSLYADISLNCCSVNHFFPSGSNVHSLNHLSCSAVGALLSLGLLTAAVFCFHNAISSYLSLVNHVLPLSSNFLSLNHIISDAVGAQDAVVAVPVCLYLTALLAN